ncbi:ATP-binding protein [Actinomadura welshii]|uniref:ATP-binding protein n=1 Tax=Actinomadura welshii TaxID=3103817 RepID=UPI00040ECFAE|nr:ATP-binding protein [Actinomadura madurae]
MRRPRWAMPGRWSLARQLLVLQAAIVGLLVAAGAILAYLDSGRAADDTARQTVTALASSIADSQNVQAALATPQPSRLLQPYAERVRHDTGVDFITIMTPAGIRYTHPNPSRIGGTFVGNTAPAVAGRTFSETYTGTLGPSVRAVAPVFGEDGRVVALVSVGITIRAISAELRQRLISLAVVAAVVLAVGMAGSYLVSARLRRQTRGVAPDELRQMFDYYEAILHAVREGLLILDRTGRVVLCNDAARDLLDLTPHPANPTAPASATPAKRRATAPATKAPTNPTAWPVEKSRAAPGTQAAAEPGVEPAEQRDVSHGTRAAANPGEEPVERRDAVRWTQAAAGSGVEPAVQRDAPAGTEPAATLGVSPVDMSGVVRESRAAAEPEVGPGDRRDVPHGTQAATNPSAGPVDKSGAVRGTKRAAEPDAGPADLRDAPAGTEPAADRGGRPVEESRAVRGTQSAAEPAERRDVPYGTGAAANPGGEPVERRDAVRGVKGAVNPGEEPVDERGVVRGSESAAELGVGPAERLDVTDGTEGAAKPGVEPVERRGVVRGADSVAKGRVGGRSERVGGRARGVVAAGDVQGRLVTELGLPEELVATLMSAEPRSDEIHVGDTRVLVVNTSPVRSRDRAMGNVVTLRDHTELQGLTGELDTVRGFAESLRSQAHEAANRLHTVVSLVELGRPEQAVEFATAELETAQRLTDRVVGSVTEPVLAALLLGKSAEAGERGVELVIAEDAVIEAVIEPRDLVTILGNLIDNAVDAAIEGAVHRPPRVVVAAREEEGELVLEVSDSGPGVDPSAVPAMFRRGWTTKSSGGPVGHGLGLALVGQAVRRHGGEVAVGAGRESGAVFTVRLPGDKR